MTSVRRAWTRFLHGPRAALLTHSALVLLTVALFALLLTQPLWIAFIPSVVILHRVSVLLHEYVHGIPFVRYSRNLSVVTFFDGVLLCFGLIEVFRGTHLAHHRWLNTEREPALAKQPESAERGAARPWSRKLSALIHVRFFAESLNGSHPYVRVRRVALAAALSAIWVATWAALGHPEMVWKLLAVNAFCALVPFELRGAVEHHSAPGDPASSNEYRALIPIFNVNRHRHHHEEPRQPWYLLEYRTPAPLEWWHAYTSWFRLHLKQELVRMQPMTGTGRETGTRASAHELAGGPATD